MKKQSHTVRFEVFTAVTMKNGVFWDVTPCGHRITRNTVLLLYKQYSINEMKLNEAEKFMASQIISTTFLQHVLYLHFVSHQ
jgi:hypothetical protein